MNSTIIIVLELICHLLPSLTCFMKLSDPVYIYNCNILSINYYLNQYVAAYSLSISKFKTNKTNKTKHQSKVKQKALRTHTHTWSPSTPGHGFCWLIYPMTLPERKLISLYKQVSDCK